ncbi:MAG: hypothetical protein QG656_2111 [Candidatus Hydrogenedentes bacterium]|nr:hypothetical protein [Candidatus Hydrogenedentota bacterium]
MRIVALITILFAAASGAETVVSAADYDSIQAAIDAHPGKMIFVPDGDYAINKKLRIASDNGGLYGYGRIVQTNPAEVALEIEHAAGVRISGITLTRAEGKQDAEDSGLFCYDARDTVIENVRVIDCRARAAAIALRECRNCTVRDCEVRNYKRIAVDDRTAEGETLYGYAFHCIDGTGILVERCTGTVIENNRVVENNLFPTPEMKAKYNLGALTEGRYPSKQGALATEAFRSNYVGNWHQGSAITVTGPEDTRHSSIRGNYIENAAQGIDLHCDNALVTDNTVNHGMMGIKATHGSRNLLIANNMLTHIDLWGILLNPGAASHAAEPATAEKVARVANVDGGTIIANNIISDYGYGHEFWNYGGREPDHPGSYAIALYEGQLDTNPPLTDVIVTGNMVYDTGRDQVIVDGQPRIEPPRYRYAVYVGPWGGEEPGPTYPQSIHFSNNLFHPGSMGVSNVELKP